MSEKLLRLIQPLHGLSAFGFVAMACLTSVTINAAESKEASDIAVTYTLPNAVVWEPQIAFVSVSLSVAGPDGTVSSQEFPSGDEPIFSAAGQADGAYTYELRFQTVASVPPGTGADRDGLEPTAPAQLFSGGFTIANGSVVEAGMGSGDDSDGGMGTRTNIPDPLIVQGSGCFGIDCIDAESFGFDIIRVKENNLRIHFDDTSNSPTTQFPQNDWRIVINDSTNGGLSYFAIKDSTAGRVPFLVEAGAPTNSLYVDDAGRVGLGTATPVVEAHVVDGDSPTLRLEQDNTSGLTPQTWDVAGNESNFFVRDVTNGSNLPFKIRPGAGHNSLVIDSDNDIGMGVLTPAANLHVRTTAADDLELARFENTNVTPQDVYISLMNSTDIWSMSINSTDDRLELNKIIPVGFEGTGEKSGTAFSIDSNSLVVVANHGLISEGTIHHASDRNKKDSFATIEPGEVLNKVLEMPITQWKFKTEDESVRHIGPTSQDFMSTFGFGTDEKYIDTVDADGVALAAIQGLNRKLMDSLEQRDAVIEQLLARIEALEGVATPELIEPSPDQP